VAKATLNLATTKRHNKTSDDWVVSGGLVVGDWETQAVQRVAMLTQFRRGNNLHVFCELERGKGEMGELLGNVVGGKYVALGVFRGQFRPPTVAMLCWLAAAFYLTPHCPPFIPPAPVIIPPYLSPHFPWQKQILQQQRLQQLLHVDQ